MFDNYVIIASDILLRAMIISKTNKQVQVDMLLLMEKTNNQEKHIALFDVLN
jgi:hypothetical protein